MKNLISIVQKLLGNKSPIKTKLGNKIFHLQTNKKDEFEEHSPEVNLRNLLDIGLSVLSMLKQ